MNEQDALAQTVALLRAQSVDDFPGAVGHAGLLAVTVAIRAWLAGLSNAARSLVAERREWLRRSLADGESFGAAPLLTAAQVADALAVSTWLVDNRDPVEERHDALVRYQRFLADSDAQAAERLDIERLDVERLVADDHVPPSPADITRAEAVLDQHGLDWVNDGQTLRLAGWLKLRYWNTGLALAPEQALRRAPMLAE